MVLGVKRSTRLHRTSDLLLRNTLWRGHCWYRHGSTPLHCWWSQPRGWGHIGHAPWEFVFGLKVEAHIMVRLRHGVGWKVWRRRVGDLHGWAGIGMGCGGWQSRLDLIMARSNPLHDFIWPVSLDSSVTDHVKGHANSRRLTKAALTSGAGLRRPDAKFEKRVFVAFNSLVMRPVTFTSRIYRKTMKKKTTLSKRAASGGGAGRGWEEQKPEVGTRILTIRATETIERSRKERWKWKARPCCK